MSVETRLLGQGVTILCSQDGDLVEEFADISNFTWTDMYEIISKGYLGQKTEKKDMVYKGVEGSLTMEMPSVAYFRFAARIKDRAKGDAPDMEVNFQFVGVWPNGDVATVSFNDVSFGPMPVNVPSRAEYVNVQLSFQVEDTTVSFG